MRDVPSPAALPTGTRLAHYEIAGLVGTGGMGQVYRAHDLKLQRDIALKLQCWSKVVVWNAPPFCC